MRESINEREVGGRARRSAGRGRHGSKAALLGAGEASEEVTMAVVLQGSAVGGGGVRSTEAARGLSKGLCVGVSDRCAGVQLVGCFSVCR